MGDLKYIKDVKDMNDAEKAQLYNLIRGICYEKAIAHLCIELGFRRITPAQQKRCIEILKEQIDSPNASQLVVDYRAAQHVGRSIVDVEMSELLIEKDSKRSL